MIPKTLKMITGRAGRYDRFFPNCEFSRMLCDLIRRNNEKTANCLTTWQVDMLKKNGFEISVEEE